MKTTRLETYKFGRMRFDGPRLSRVSVKVLQQIYNDCQAQREPLSTLVKVARAFGLTKEN